MSNAYVLVSSSNVETFTNVLIGDVIIFPQSNSQRILVGNNSNSVANLTISSNATYFMGQNIGINTSNPRATLDINGDLNVSSLVAMNANVNTLAVTGNASICGLIAGNTTKLMTSSALTTSTMIVTSTGQVHVWGANNTGQLGNDTKIDSQIPINISTIATGSIYNGGNIKTIVAIAAGQYNALAIDSNGQIHGWGQITITQSQIPINISTIASGSIYNGGAIKTIVAIASGYVHMLVIDSAGQIHAWGQNNNGQLGNNTLLGNSGTTQTVPINISTIITSSIYNKKIVAITCGESYTLVIDSTGQIHAWGNNTYGQLGNNTLLGNNGTSQTIPIAVTLGSISGKTIVAITAGRYHTIALDSTGQMHAWGYNGQGEIGNNTYLTQKIPIAITLGSISGKIIVTIAAGNYHTLALDSTGQIHAWGNNSYGQLGNNTLTLSSIPINISTLATGSIYNKTIVAIAAGQSHTLVIDSTGQLHAWGLNTSGQLGNNTLTQSLVPILVTGFGSLPDISMTAPPTNAIIMKNNMIVQGDTNINGKLATTTTIDATTVTSSNLKVSGNVDFTSANINGLNVVKMTNFMTSSSLTNSTLIVTPAGEIHAWGLNANGQLGNNTVTQSQIPINISKVAAGSIYNTGTIKTIVAITNGASHTIALDSTGQIHAWGLNTNGQLGNNTLTQSQIPINISTVATGSIYNGGGVNIKTIVAIATGASYTLGLDSAGQIHAWGLNTNGQLGNNTLTQSQIPINISTVATGSIYNGGVIKTIVAIIAGAAHTLALDSTGQVHAWGANASGQLGNNTLSGNSGTNQTIPINISTIISSSLYNKTIVTIAAGNQHNIAIDSTGQIHAWGYNGQGQLGNITTTNSPIPINISTIATSSIYKMTITAVALGGYYSTVIDSNGEVHAWGANNVGQLGNNTTAYSSPTPVNISIIASGSIYNNGIIKRIIAIAAGDSHTLAIDSVGYIHAWGFNGQGQLGNNTIVYSSIPIKITGFGSISSISTTAPLAGQFFVNFTGQHRAFLNDETENKEGLIVVSDQNEYITGGPDNMNPYGQFIRGHDAISINDALPIVSLANTAYDKRVFGILSSEIFATSPEMVKEQTAAKHNKLAQYGDVRIEINAIGDGAIWVTDINGPLNSGDLITSSIIPGYGQLQSTDDVFHNYTVAKITCNCDFSNKQRPIYVINTDVNGLNILDPISGKPTWVQKTETIMVDPTTNEPPPSNIDGSIPEPLNLVSKTIYLTESLFKTRYLTIDGTKISQEEYDAIIATTPTDIKPMVYRAAFVGCTYHCG